VLYGVPKGDTSLEYNVYTSNQNTVFTSPTNYRYTGQSLLMFLGDYGGSTTTMPINTAISDWETIVKRVPVDTSRTTDQRGLPVPTTGLACAGAVEMQAGEHYTSLIETRKEQISIFPNPVSDSFRIGGIEENTLVTVLDMVGKTVLQQTVNRGESVAVGRLPKGVYLIVVKGKTLKMIKN